VRRWICREARVVTAQAERLDPLVLAIIAMVVVLSKIGRGADAREP
jgi:hypothetical protein